MLTSQFRLERRQRGTQIAELAIVLPLLVLVAFLTIEGAAFVRIHQVLVNAARETARAAILQENKSDLSSMLENIGSCYLVHSNVSVNQTVVCGQQTVTPPASPTCSSYSIAITGFNGVPALPPIQKADGSFMNVTRVTASCGYTFSLLPRLKGLGFKLPNTVTLASAVEFRNFD